MLFIILVDLISELQCGLIDIIGSIFVKKP